MTRKILSAGVLLLVGTALVFTAFAQQDPEQDQEPASSQQETQAQTQQESEKPEITPFHEILAEKLGVDDETLQQALEEARAEFQAQLPERAQRSAEGRFQAQQGKGPQGQMMGQGQMQRQGRFQGGFQGKFQGGFGQSFGSPGMVKTTITHEFYHMGGPNQGFFQNNSGPGGPQQRQGRP